MSTQLKCKPGDLAVVAKALTRRDEWSLGLFVRVVSLNGMNLYGEKCWRIETPVTSPSGFTAIGFPDECLRPLRPGETPEQSTEAMRRLHETPAKEPVVKPFQWEEL